MTLFGGITALIILIAVVSGLQYVFYKDRKNIEAGRPVGLQTRRRDRE